MLVKLLSADEKIVLVDQNVIKQMVAIQRMLDCPRVEDDSDDPIPIFGVHGEVLEKLVGWTKYHLENNTKSDHKVWCHQFFMDNLEEIFMLEDGAKYLELESYLHANDIFMDENFQLLSNTEVMRNISSDRFRLFLGRDTLSVPSEQALVESLQTWISVDPEDRSTYLGNLIPYIRASFLPRQSVEDVKNFLVEHNNPDLCEKLNFENRTPRLGYEECIVALHQMPDGGRCLKYLDSKVWFIFCVNLMT